MSYASTGARKFALSFRYSPEIITPLSSSTTGAFVAWMDVISIGLIAAATASRAINAKLPILGIIDCGDILDTLLCSVTY